MPFPSYNFETALDLDGHPVGNNPSSRTAFLSGMRLSLGTPEHSPAQGLTCLSRVLIWRLIASIWDRR